MGLVAAILGLAVLVMIHEAGHFFAARAVGMTPRKFILGFGRRSRCWTPGGVEYGIGSIPLGGYVQILRTNRQSAGDLAATLQPRGPCSPTGPSSRASTMRSSGRTSMRRVSTSPSCEPRSARRACGRSSNGRSRRMRTGARTPGAA